VGAWTLVRAIPAGPPRADVQRKRRPGPHGPWPSPHRSDLRSRHVDL